MSQTVATSSLLTGLGVAEYRHVVFQEPSRARSGVVNLAPPESIAPPASRILTGDEEAFLRWLFQSSGLELNRYRVRSLRRRIGACLRSLGARSPSHARRMLEAKPALIPGALSNLIIGVTSFFRDPGVFGMLERELLPGLLATRYGLSIWCVGCSDGSELYSLAMLLSEMGALHRCHLLGTDCRSDAVARARDGVFDAAALRGLADRWKERFFHPVSSGRWRICELLRRAAHWRRADVLCLQEPGVWDIIACRNMAMYLTPGATAELWARLELSLRPGGLLLLGRAERPAGTCHLSEIDPCIYRRDRG